MKNCHITKQSKCFFEGWYLKHQKGNQTISFIPGVHITENGIKKAFIQIISNDKSYLIDYDYKDFHASKHRFYIKIGDNIFCDKGIIVNIHTPDINCSGKIYYRHLTPPAYDIMGPFAIFPKMECNHGIISLHHTLKGFLTINGSIVSFNEGVGYIEKDWGSSFPKSYTWIQCNDFQGVNSNEKRAVMISVADIPFKYLSFQGLIAVVCFRGKEYRFATYNRGKIILHTPRKIILEKGKYRLVTTVKKSPGKSLKAPDAGDMTRFIEESAACKAHFELFYDNQKIFSCSSENTSYEHAE